MLDLIENISSDGPSHNNAGQSPVMVKEPEISGNPDFDRGQTPNETLL